MARLVRLAVAVAVLCTAATAAAQSHGDVVVGDISSPQFKWGEHTFPLEVTNGADYTKFLTVVSRVEFSGDRLNPTRRVTSHFVVGPGKSVTITPDVDVPGNYGTARLTVDVYDVIDTLDAVMEDMLARRQEVSLSFAVPDGVRPYLSVPIEMPPMVGKSRDFDHELSRLLLPMIAEGKNITEMAAILEVDTAIVVEPLRAMALRGYCERHGDSIAATMPIIMIDEARAGEKVAEALADDLATMISKNMDAYDAVVDSLLDAGAMSEDTNWVMHGGTIFHFKYPTVAVLFLWYYMGRGFIVQDPALQIFRNTDPCNARIGQFMYAVQGGDKYNGHQYYNWTPGDNTFIIFYGADEPVLSCPEEYPRFRNLAFRYDWNYAEQEGYEQFTVDTRLAQIIFGALSEGADKFLVDRHKEAAEVAKAHGHDVFGSAFKYWFWNLTATKTLDKLVSRGVLTPRSSGQFRIDRLDTPW